MNHLTTDFLHQLPFPLMAPSSQISRSTPELPRRRYRVLAENEQRYRAIYESLVDVSDILEDCPEGLYGFTRDFNLTHIFGTFYHSSRSTNLLFRLAAVHRSIADYSLPTFRISRETAAWIWGLLPHCDSIHMDFRREHRIGPELADRCGITAHQLRSWTSEHSVFFGELEITGVQQTLIDLLQNCPEDTALTALGTLQTLPHLELTIEALKEEVQGRRYLQRRDRALRILEKATYSEPAFKGRAPVKR